MKADITKKTETATDKCSKGASLTKKDDKTEILTTRMLVQTIC